LPEIAKTSDGRRAIKGGLADDRAGFGPTNTWPAANGPAPAPVWAPVWAPAPAPYLSGWSVGRG